MTPDPVGQSRRAFEDGTVAFPHPAMTAFDWEHPWLLLLAVPALAWLFWADATSSQPLEDWRKRALLITRAGLVLLVIVALASPARVETTSEPAAVLVIDDSRSMGEAGAAAAREAAEALRRQWPGHVSVGAVLADAAPQLLAAPAKGEAAWPWPEPPAQAAQTNLAAAVSLAEGLFPAGVSRHVVVISDGEENRGHLLETARRAAASGLRLHTLAIVGEARPDARISSLVPSQTRVTEGASVELAVTVESSLAGSAQLKLFENGLLVAQQTITLTPGNTLTTTFTRTLDEAGARTFRAVLEGAEGDTLPENNGALTLIDVRGRPLLLYVEGEAEEAHYLASAMEPMGLRLHVRSPQTMPQTLRELNAYDAVILSDVPSHQLSDSWMAALRDYVGQLGGGLMMIGGRQSFGVGGYYRTPVEELLPVKLQAPDQEEQQSSAVALVLDRSGSMAGPKIEFVKSAAIATAELLTAKDYLGVYAFDSTVHVVVPMSKVPASGGGSFANAIRTLGAGGGTNMQPGITKARDDLLNVPAKLKHMIVLTDGQTEGSGYEALAASIRNQGITISTVAIGQGAFLPLLANIASAGGGQAYQTLDPSTITRIFTQDTMMHTGRLIREEAFTPQRVERHPMLKDWDDFQPPPLLGYVKTNRKATSQVPLVTDLGDPLLAHWRYGLGKTTAFTSDCKSRWAAAWISGWPGYSRFWAQVLRETARPPQGHQMDLTLTQEDGATVAEVQLLEDAGTFKNNAEVEAEVFYASGSSVGAAMQPLGVFPMRQTGPGRYRAHFRPDEPGVYLVRARSGSQMVSAGEVHNPSAEAATGRVNEALLQEAAALTGGTFVPVGTTPDISLDAKAIANYVELWPWLLTLFLPLCVLDLALRRWDHVRGVGQQLSRLVRSS